MTSIIIINYNTFELTCACIRSIISKTTINYEIVLVDNASVECDPNNFLKIFPDITLVISNTNIGFSKGNNLGIANSKGDFILLLNSDTVLLNEAIDLSYSKLVSNAKIAALTGQLISPDGSLQQASYEFMPMHKLIACSLKLHRIFIGFKASIPDLTKEHFAKGIWGTFFFFRKQILNIFPEKKLSETFFMYAEDSEWCYYITKAGYKLFYFPDAKILHYGAGSGIISDKKKLTNGIANEYHLLRITKGRLYVTFYFLAKSLFYLSCLNKTSLTDASYMASIAMKNLIKYKYYLES